MIIPERIEMLRAAMREHQVDAYLVPSSDPHQSEYVADHWKGREWLSGFTGSAGMVVVTLESAALWTDARYLLQGEKQLRGSGIQLMEVRNFQQPEFINWIGDQLSDGATLGCDGRLFSFNRIKHLRKVCQKVGVTLDHKLDLLCEVWEDRPLLPADPIFEFPKTYSGEVRSSKLRRIRAEMKDLGVTHHLVTSLDDIAWTLNIRGADISFNPVAICFLLVGEQETVLFIQEEKVPLPLKRQLANDGVDLKPYGEIVSFLRQLPEASVVLIDPRIINMELFSTLSRKDYQMGRTIPRQLKAIKNTIEIGHVREAMIKDGIALVKLFRWLEAILDSREVTEYEVSRQLDKFRRAQGDYHGESFAAIVGYQGNGAIVHYRPHAEDSAVIRKEGILLLDSGGQYLQGTTDITRTVTLGDPTDEQCRLFTLVLKGHISLAQARFPQGTTGVQLDVLARLPLWKSGCNYSHGTGHGVGFFLNVHEAPQGFATRDASQGGTTLHFGMLTSNEPGYYQEGEFGIRIENLILCVESENEGFLEFETMTLFPIDLDLVVPELLSIEEKKWLNDYHQRVYEALEPQLQPEEVEWLQLKCRPVG